MNIPKASSIPMHNLPVDVPPHVAETIQAIALLHAEHHRKSTLAERVVDHATGFVGRPIFLIMLLAAAILWIGVNVIIGIAGGTPPDPPPFAWMGLFLAAVALVIAVMIL